MTVKQEGGENLWYAPKRRSARASDPVAVVRRGEGFCAAEPLQQETAKPLPPLRREKAKKHSVAALPLTPFPRFRRGAAPLNYHRAPLFPGPRRVASSQTVRSAGVTEEAPTLARLRPAHSHSVHVYAELGVVDVPVFVSLASPSLVP